MATDGGAGMVIAVSHIATASSAIACSTIDWIKFRKPSVVGTVTGVIACLATVTPASGYVGPAGGLIVSAVAGVVYFLGIDTVKERWKTDDSLHVFAVHGVGGMMGLLVAFLAVAVLSGDGLG